MLASSWIMRALLCMMGLPTCEEVDQFAYDFFAQKLSPEVNRQVERHLGYCNQCRKFMKSYQRVVREARPPDPPTLDASFRRHLAKLLIDSRLRSR